jgi:hypothetical protein
MTTRRLEAWTRIMGYDENISALFVTNSRSAFEHVIERSPAAQPVFCSDSPAMCAKRSAETDPWQDDLMEFLERLVHHTGPLASEFTQRIPATQSNNPKEGLTLYIMPGENPSEVFNRCLKQRALQTEKGRPITRFQNTLIGFIEIVS